MSDRDIRTESIDLTSRKFGLGSMSDAFTGLFYGMNHGSTGNPIPYNTESRGLVFFVRPRMNLSYQNLSMVRKMMNYGTKDPYTMQSILRAYLDPVGDWERRNRSDTMSSAFVDPYCAFIPMLSNLLLEINGWPDKTLGTFESRAGIQRETWSMVDDISTFYGSYELPCSFRSVKGDPVTHLLDLWCDYASHVYMGTMDPYFDAIVENEIDYTTCIYRIVLDETHQFVQKIMSTGYAFPTAAPIGASGNYSVSTPFNMDVAQQVSTSFKAQGFIWNDPILIYKFNRTVAMFNPHMRVDNLRRSDSLMVELSPSERVMMRGYGTYPRIEPRSFEMKWYAFRFVYDAIINLKLPDKIPVPGFGFLEGRGETP